MHEGDSFPTKPTERQTSLLEVGGSKPSALTIYQGDRMFIKSKNDKNEKRVNLTLVTGYYPDRSDGGICIIKFMYQNFNIIWYYESEEDRDKELDLIDFWAEQETG